ncbi:MAG: dihydrodipicolinate synthase family protein [Planctomycetaceae bacterium]|nr:dihydrodipicolinate synthase family protein [Planctomycetaceae bacterium]
MTNRIEGVLPVVHTPFDSRGEIDIDSLQREVDWVFEVGADGICSAMVSELLRLTTQERNALNRSLVQMVKGRGVVVASVGAESTKQAIEYAHAAEQAGCDAIMAIPPISTALPDAALWDYFSSLANSVAIPLIVQDASSYVGAAISTQFYVRLLNEFGPENILFKPEGAPIGPNISDLRDASHGRARIFDGSGGVLLIDAFRRGIAGTMPGVDLLDGIVEMWRSLKLGHEQRAYEIYFPICGIVALQLQAGLDGFLAIEKHILVRRGIFSSASRRMPYSWSLDRETQEEVDRLLDMLLDKLASDASTMGA